ncbi:multidrug efflux pump-associated protein AcrZ [Enterobacter sp. BIGb0383]|nr:multidrug efflux pump-associated protein AcrZ [Enterobacter sp. BIGb0383]
MTRSQYLELTMFELLKSLVFAVVMVPVVMAIILGLIYGLGEVFNIFSNIGHKDRTRSEQHR